MESHIFHLYETLTKMRVFPSKDDKMISLDNPEDLNYLNGKFKNYNEFDNSLLSDSMSGWVKYNYYVFNDLLKLHHKTYMIRNLLHIIHSANDDLIIARVIKFDKKQDKYSVRYIIFKKNREQSCSSLKELNTCLKNSFEYDGRQLTKDDFNIEG